MFFRFNRGNETKRKFFMFRNAQLFYNNKRLFTKYSGFGSFQIMGLVASVKLLFIEGIQIKLIKDEKKIAT